MTDLAQRLAGLTPKQREVLLRKLGERSAAPSEVPIPRLGREEDRFSLSFSQLRQWILDRLEPGTPAYNLPAAIRLHGHLDVAALEGGVHAVLDRHEALRTTFEDAQPEPLQVIHAHRRRPLPVVDLNRLASAGREAEATRLAAAEAKAPFDLRRGPLVRFRLLRLGTDEHLFLFTMHHIVSDGWSLGVFFRELGALYASRTGGPPAALGQLPVQYADFAAWQRQRLSGAELERHLDYWRRQLAGLPPQLELPTDRPRPAFQSYAGQAHVRPLPAALATGLRALAGDHSASLFMVLLAAFNVLLHRYGGQSNFAVGTFIANRNRSEIADLIGFFVNTLVLRTRLVGAASFAELLARVREVTLDAYAHQDLPFEKLLEQLQPERDTSHTPLFQVMLVLQNLPALELKLGDLSLSFRSAERRRSNFDLTLWMWEDGRSLQAVLDYRTDLFDATTTGRLLGHFEHLLAALVDDPSQPLAALALQGPAERHQLLREWADTVTPFPAGTVDQLIAAQAARSPEAPAVLAGREELTYGELDRRANQLARYLRRRGVGPECIVGLALDRSPQMVVALVAVLRAGGAYLPLDPAYPAERLAYMLADARAVAVLTRGALAERLPAGTPRVDLDAEQPAVERCEDGALSAGGGAESLAYVIYTSGSTGRPKGVGVPHRALANYVRHAAREFALGPADRVLQFASVSFDTSAEEIYPCLVRGATLVLRDDAMLESASRFLAAVGERGITVLDLPTAYWHDLVAALGDGGPRFPAACRLVIIGGEKARADRLEEWLGRVGPGVRLVNTYGPTETAIVATRWQPGVVSWEVPIGRPIANARVRLLDPRLRPVPLGVPGELGIAGRGVARGYLGRPGPTAERFVPDPAADRPGERLYRSGDLARYLPDGSLEFRGRADHQVKVRGFRVELGEVEAALARHPAVCDAAVVTQEAPGGLRLVAYLSCDPEPAVGQLRDALRAELPDYMVPAAFVFLPTLPRTPSGKIDRRALPEPDRSRPELRDRYVAPRGPIEEFLAETWAELLGLEQVGTGDSFFELGGHSLLAAQLAGRVRQAFDVELPLLDVFNTPTVAELARRIERAERAERGVELPPLRRVPRDRPLPLSFPQERVWFLLQLVPGNLAYNFQLVLLITGPLQVAVLTAVFDETIRRHEIYRTTFPAVDGRPVQVIHPPWRVSLPVVDLRRLTAEARDPCGNRLLGDFIRRSFDVTRLPLVRWLLFRLGDEEWALVHAEHHFVHDGWSIAVLLRELKALYEAFAAGRPSPLPALPVQYADFAAWQRGWMQGEILARQLSYWKGRLAGSPPVLELPADRPRPPLYRFRGGLYVDEFDTAHYAQLRHFSRRQGATLFMVFTAAFATLLYRHSGQADVPIGTAVANRRLRETEDLIGMIVNTLVLRTDLGGDPTFGELVRRVRQVVLEAHTYQDMPFEKLVEELQPERDLSHNPLFQVMFSFHDAQVPRLEFGGLRGELRGAHNRTAKTDLNLVVLPHAEQHVGLGESSREEELAIYWEYNSDIFDRTTVARWAQRYRVLLAAVAANPERRLSELEWLTPAERRQHLVEWNATAVDYPRDATIHRLFKAQVAKRPTTVAVAGSGRELTYGELNARSELLARYLRSLGVGPEVLVGILTERSPEMVVAVLGVLMAGGAFIPIDPEHPAERIALMLADSRAEVVVTESGLLAKLPPELASPARTGTARVVCLDRDWESAAQQADEIPGRQPTPDNLAYVIYTSGSTGRPKGVQIAHRPMVSLLTTMRRWPGLLPEDRMLAVTTLSFDIAGFELFLTLTTGARLEIATSRTAVDGKALIARLRESAITVMQATPATWRLLLSAGWQGGEGIRVFCGGEEIPRQLAAGIMARSSELWNIYGPTEATVYSIGHRVTAAAGPVPIGRPLGNIRALVLDRRLHPLPVGVPGELYLGGECLSRGYLGSPGLTAERFVPDPLGAAPGGRLYGTGDLARWRADGEIEYLGRRDFQVKIRGFRIELGEIEATLARHPGVGQAVAAAREDTPGDKRLVAYLIPADGEVPEPDELRDFLREKLPPYMVPTVFMPLDELPLTPSGKVDRKRLPAPVGLRPESKATFVAPRNDVEEALAAIWSEVLGLERPGVEDNFFRLGGHSLTATQVLARIRTRFGVELPLASFFDGPTVAQLAAAVSARQQAGEIADLVPTPRAADLPEDQMDRLDELSDAELDAMLAAMSAEGES